MSSSHVTFCDVERGPQGIPVNAVGARVDGQLTANEQRGLKDGIDIARDRERQSSALLVTRCHGEWEGYSPGGYVLRGHFRRRLPGRGRLAALPLAAAFPALVRRPELVRGRVQAEDVAVLDQAEVDAEAVAGLGVDPVRAAVNEVRACRASRKRGDGEMGGRP